MPNSFMAYARLPIALLLITADPKFTYPRSSDYLATVIVAIHLPIVRWQSQGVEEMGFWQQSLQPHSG